MTDEDSAPVILAVDRNQRNLELLSQFLKQQGYQVLAKISLEEVGEVTSIPSTIKLALIDISGFDASVWGLCQRLREQGIPFLVISPRQYAAIQQASIAHGALGLLNKPLMMREFLQLIRDLLKGSE
ncbi:response regulator [Leptolyngbya sp. FACHB-36]|uniref:response regulator n=1 Tax=Leptolyngbya sp. FACHB-36 TaxID=2692808 RepID=UPI00168108B7|nr:response regulator [Leptolyngbya sp. FACHB-36]MBD2022455.1 response regulator [Leptolyngbya sp. FACHB-36]